jgi:hypothetical protein
MGIECLFALFKLRSCSVSGTMNDVWMCCFYAETAISAICGSEALNVAYKEELKKIDVG